MSDFGSLVRLANVDAIIQVGVGYARELKWLLPLCKRPLLYGFDPSPKVRQYWNANSYPGLLFSIGLHAGRGTMVLNDANRCEKSSMIHRPARSTPVRVPVDSLDAFQKRYGVVGRRILLWMDCEGSELSVLAGARYTLRNVAIVVAEVVDNPTNGWPRRDDIAAHLVAKGFYPQFRMHRIGECFARRL